jgi:ComF family protein
MSGGGLHPGEGRAASRQHAALGAEAEVGEQAVEAAIAHVERFAVRDGEREAGAGEQVAGRTHVDLRMDARRHPAAVACQIRLQHRGSQTGQTASAEETAEEQSVRSQHPSYQQESARQIVDAVQHAGGHHKVEAAVREGQAILVALDIAMAPRRREAGVTSDHRQAACFQRAAHMPFADTDHQSAAERAIHRFQPGEQFVGDVVGEEAVIDEACHGAIAARAAAGAIEGLVRSGGHERACAAMPADRQEAMATAASRLVSGLWSSAIDFALPPRCPGCGLIVDGDHRFCVDCWQALEFLGPPACARCAVPLPHDLGEDALCGACHADPPAFDRAAAAVAYGDIAKAVALRLKYGRRPGVARMMAGQMARLARDAPAGSLVIPVPLHRWRLWSRGYNQALLIGRHVARQAGLECLPDVLIRTKATPVLRGLGRKARAKAVSGAFAVAPSRKVEIKGRPVLLIDDVYTSGATAGACAKVLKRAGASEVRLLCWARVLREDEARR